MCDLNPPRFVIEDLKKIDLSSSEPLMLQYLTEKNSPIAVGMYATERFMFYRDGEWCFATGFNTIAIHLPCELSSS